MAPPVSKQKNTMLCTGCKQTIPNEKYLTCLNCKKYYDLECAKVTERQYKNLIKDDEQTWECPECLCKRPKINNSNTPVRSHSTANNYNISRETNVTFRNKQSQSQHNNDTINSEDLSILGDTIETNIETCIGKELSLHNLSEIITVKLKENNKSIIQEIQIMIQSEFNKAILKLTEDTKQETIELLKQNDQRKAEMEALNLQIERLKKETDTIKYEIKKLANTPASTESNARKFVLYGFKENQRESEYDLHGRIINMFRDTLQIDLLGYIEDTYRIGRQNQNKTRPLVIELISKRMVKYLINNNGYLYGTGLSISGLLNEAERKERNIMREKMIYARKQGIHAVIRNGKLFIEGEQIQNRDDLDTRINNKSENKDTTYTYNITNDASSTTTSEINQENHTFRKNRTTF